MLKEKLYSEYQKRYKEYIEKHKKVEELQRDVADIQAEGQRKKSEIENQKKSELSKLSNRKKELERQLASVKKEGTNSTVVIEYSESKLRDIDKTEDGLRSLEQEKNDELKNLQRKKKEAISEIESDKDLCQRRLNDLMSGGNGSAFVKQFDEGQLRQKLAKDKEREVVNLSGQYDTSVSQTQESLAEIDSEYAGIMQRELSYIENDANLCELCSGLNAKAVNNELPQVITGALSEPMSDVIQRNGINGGQRIAQIAYSASPLDDLSRYTPEWLVKLVNIGFPLIVGAGLLAFFIFSGIHFGIVATATNAIASFLLWLVGAAIVGGIGYGITEAKWGKGIVGGIIGVILGFWIAMHWSVTLPYGVTNVVEWIIKGLICLVVGIGLYFLNTCTGVGSAFISIGMKIGFIKKAALVQQGYVIQENADSYYALIKYREIIEQVVNENKQRKYSYLTSELERLKGEKNSAVDSLAKKIDRETEQTVSDERASAEASRKKYEQKQLDLIQMQDECMMELSGYDGRIQDKTSEYDEKIKMTTASYDKKIADTKEKLQRLKSGVASDKDSLLGQLANDIESCGLEYSSTEAQFDKQISETVELFERQVSNVNAEIKTLQDLFKPEFDSIYKLFMKIYEVGSPELVETRGMASDTLYIFNDEVVAELDKAVKNCNGETGDLFPVLLHEIRHEKNPIVFLYESKDSSTIATDLFRFMDAINIGLYTINCKRIYDLFITDPKSKGINFKEQQKSGRLTIVDDIKELDEIIGDSMDFVASKGQKISIDELNAELVAKGNDEEDINKFGKYKIVQFIVPEEESIQTTDFFNNDIWTRFETSKKHGFLPIFYIEKNDWESALDDEEKFNSKFIMKLNKALGSKQNNIFEIDTKNISVKKYSK